jgi:hypothetical protein
MIKILPPKKLVWRSVSSVVDVAIWLAIFHSLDFRSVTTYLILLGILSWTFISEWGSHLFSDEKKKVEA